MKEQAVLVPSLLSDAIRWNLRRAELVDVPAVARLIDPPPPANRPGITDHTAISATRLVLAHVGLEHGEFQVATDEHGAVRAATVLLPPRLDAAGHPTFEGEGMQSALRLHLGLSAGQLPDLSALTGVPALHWLLLAVCEPGAQSALPGLLAATLPAVPRDGLPVLTVQPGRATAALLAAGFEAVDGGPGLSGLTALVLPATEPLDAEPMDAGRRTAAMA